MKVAILILALSAHAAAAETGALRGVLREAGTGIPLPGANVLLQGTLLGMATDPQGRFHFEAVPPGTYTLSCSMVGYGREEVAGLVVDAGDTLELAVELTPVAIQTAPVVVTASRREQAIQESPVSIAVLDAAGLEFRNAQTLDQGLRYIPGVNITESQVNIRGSSGYSRGAGSRVLMLVDGIPMMTGDTGEINFEVVPTGEVDRIEVVKVASSALYGSSALGGVINILTRPIPKAPRTTARIFGGAYAGPSHPEWTWSDKTRTQGGFSFSHSRRIGELAFRAFASGLTDDGYRQNDDRRRLNAALKVRYDFSSFSSLTATLNYMDQKRGSFLYWKDQANALLPPDEQLGQRIHSTRFYASAVYDRVLSGSLVMSIKGLWFRNRFQSNISEGGGDLSLSNVVHAGIQTIWTPGKMHIVTAGVDGNLDRVDADLFGVRSGAGIAAYAQDEVRLAEALRLTLGARFDYQDLDSLAAASQLNPKAALVFTPAKGTTLRASLGRGFRTPTVAEAFTSTVAAGILIVPNPALVPERSLAAEMGVNQVLGDVALIDAALFQTDFTNLIEAGFNDIGQGQFQNVTDARIRGAELAVSLSLLRRLLFLSVGYTYVDPKDLTTGEVLKYRPRHLVYVTAAVTVGEFEFGADYRHLSRVEAIDEEFVTLGIIKDGGTRVPVNVVDLRARWSPGIAGLPISLLVNVNNVLQYNYIELIGNLGPPRTVLVTLEGAF
jgi:outer membrane receptor for ferrienterochelin and colicins